MKYLLIAILAVASLASCSHKHKENPKLEGMSFEELRAWKTEYLAKKMDLIKQEQFCIDAAVDKPGLKKCTENINEKWKEAVKELNKKK